MYDVTVCLPISCSLRCMEAVLCARFSTASSRLVRVDRVDGVVRVVRVVRAGLDEVVPEPQRQAHANACSCMTAMHDDRVLHSNVKKGK